jgi:outer membrane autotransporter protein
MRVKIYASVLLACAMAGSHTAYAQQVINGATPTPLSVTGGTSGVSMTGQGGGGTLIVGTIGGPQSDIFTNNSSAGAVTNPLLRAVSTDTSSQSNIVFNSSSNVYGALGITNPGGPFFLNINGGNNGTAVNFNGSLYGTITTVSGTGALNFNSGATNITATNFAGNGTISLGPNTTLTGAMTTNTANTGTLVMAGGSALTGAVGGANGIKAINVVGGSNNAGVSASISGAVNAYSFNLGTNTLNVGGALTVANQTPVGVINTTLASPTVYGKIVSTGAVNLGSTLLVNVAVPQTAFIPIGTQFTIVQAGSGTNGSVVTVVNDPTNPLYTFSAVPVAGTVAGQVVIQTTGIPLTVSPSPAVPAILAAASVAGAGAAGAATSDLVTNVLPAVNAISSAPTVVNAVAQFVPSSSALGASQVTFDGARAFQNLLSSHIYEGMCGPGSSADDQRKVEDQRRPQGESSTCPESGQYDGLWAKAFGYFANQSTQGSALGYSAKILGAMVGYDRSLNVDTRAGLGLGYARSTIKGKSGNDSTGINTYQVTAYIAHEDGTWFANGDLSYGWNSYSGMRHIVFPGIDRRAFAKYSGEDFTSLLSIGRHFFLEDVTVTPQASLQATHVNLGDYTETGAGDISLKVASQNRDFLESGLGVNAARHFDLDDGRDLLPEVHAKWLHEFLNAPFSRSATFVAPGSTSFDTFGLRPSPETINLGTGVTLLSCACDTRSWSVEAVYDFYWRTRGYSAHQGMLEASYRF